MYMVLSEVDVCQETALLTGQKQPPLRQKNVPIHKWILPGTFAIQFRPPMPSPIATSPLAAHKINYN